MDKSVLDEVAAATGLREGPAGVEALARAVFRNPGSRLADVARAARLPLPVATAIRRELEKRRILQRDQGLAFTRDGETWAREALGLTSVGHDATCPACAGRGLILEGPFEQAKTVLEQILTVDAPAVDTTLDQAPCTPATTILRIALMHRAGSIEGRRILLIGDDDSVSLGLVATEIALRSGPLAREIAIVDIDAARLAFLAEKARAMRNDAEHAPGGHAQHAPDHAEHGSARPEHGVLETLAHDLREPLPTARRDRYDVVVTDPPYTLEGAELFLTRAVEALEGGRGEVYFSFAHWPPKRTLELQRLFLDLGLAVRAVHPGFNRYEGAAILGGTGQLFELVATGADLPEPATWEGALYTAEVTPRERHAKRRG